LGQQKVRKEDNNDAGLVDHGNRLMTVLTESQELFKKEAEDRKIAEEDRKIAAEDRKIAAIDRKEAKTNKNKRA
jgi:hypothetical protein